MVLKCGRCPLFTSVLTAEGTFRDTCLSFCHRCPLPREGRIRSFCPLIRAKCTVLLVFPALWPKKLHKVLHAGFPAPPPCTYLQSRRTLALGCHCLLHPPRLPHRSSKARGLSPECIPPAELALASSSLSSWAVFRVKEFLFTPPCQHPLGRRVTQPLNSSLSIRLQG